VRHVEHFFQPELAKHARCAVGMAFELGMATIFFLAYESIVPPSLGFQRSAHITHHSHLLNHESANIMLNTFFQKRLLLLAMAFIRDGSLHA
jgi:hypothetical protein